MRVKQSDQAVKAYWTAVTDALRADLSRNGLYALRRTEAIQHAEKLHGNLSNANLDQAILASLSRKLESAAMAEEDSLALTKLVGNPAPFASPEFPVASIAMIAQTAETVCTSLLHGVAEETSLASLKGPLLLLQGFDETLLQAASVDTPVAATAFEVAYLLCAVEEAKGNEDTTQVRSLAEALWIRLKKAEGGLELPDLAALIGARLGTLLMDSGCLATYVMTGSSLVILS